jgi:hypothetical protein
VFLLLQSILAVSDILAIAGVSGIACVSFPNDVPAFAGFLCLVFCLRVAVVSALLCGISGAAFTLSVAVIRAASLTSLHLLASLLRCYNVLDAVSAADVMPLNDVFLLSCLLAVTI